MGTTWKDLGAQYAIYGLSTDGVTYRYVGFTAKSGLKPRMANHRWTARHSAEAANRPMYDWMREVGPENVVATVLEKLESGVTARDLADREMHWIAQLRAEGYDLLNISNGGIGTNGVPGPRWPRQASGPVVHSRTGKKRGPYQWADVSKQAQSGARAAHNRWHVARGQIKEDCMFCSDKDVT